MLSKLKLEEYRGFEVYELADLSRVNLLVGPNNCGKTSILEAVHFLVSRGDLSVLTRSARRHGEMNDAGAEPTRRTKWSANASASPPVQFVTPDSLEVEPMRAMWDQVLIEGREAEVIGAMQLLEPELDSIHFLTNDDPQMRAGRAGVLLGFRGTGRRVPLGSYGDGMRRLLALSLSLMRTAEGFLLIDEIDTGLHWTVMEDMWRLVVETAQQSSIQVFATTHSFDCLRGLAALVESRPDLAEEISVQKIERLLTKAVGVDAQDLRVAVEQNIEVR